MTKHIFPLLLLTALSGCNSTESQPDPTPTAFNTVDSPEITTPPPMPSSSATSTKVSCAGETERGILIQIAREHPNNRLVKAINRQNPQLATYSVASAMGGQLGLEPEGDLDKEAVTQGRRYADALKNAEYSVADIRVQSRDDMLNTEVCAANLTITTQGFGSATLPIMIKVEVTTDGSPYVNVRGLQ